MSKTFQRQPPHRKHVRSEEPREWKRIWNAQERRTQDRALALCSDYDQLQMAPEHKISNRYDYW